MQLCLFISSDKTDRFIYACIYHQTFNEADRGTYVCILGEYRAICLWKIVRQIFTIIDYKALMNINRCKCLSIIDGSVFLFSRICASKKSALNCIGLFIIASTSIKTWAPTMFLNCAQTFGVRMPLLKVFKQATTRGTTRPHTKTFPVFLYAE